MLTLFISHATADDATITRIHDALTAAGIDTFVDHVDLQPGDNWDQSIHSALHTCDAGLLVLSRASAKSPECEAEYRTLLKRKVRLYVALIEPIPTEEFPWRLEIIQYTDLMRDFDAGMGELIRAILGKRDIDAAASTTKPARRITGRFPYSVTDIRLIGRDSELAEVRQSLADGQRVTAILGLGGIGKTRLAAEVATTADFRDGAVWHRIDPSTHCDRLTEAIRDHLELPVTSDADHIWASLGQKQVLIVLDNAEDCTQPGPYIERINDLNLGGGTRLLITSRYQHQWNGLHSLKRVSLHELQPDAAAELVTAMIANTPPNYDLTGHEQAIADAARRHPRLIWYAVHWANDLPAEEVIAMLRTLQGDDAEKALDDLIGKTVKRLTEQPGGPEALTALRKLAVCRGGFTLDAARAILKPVKPSLLQRVFGRNKAQVLDETGLLKILRQWGLVSLENNRHDIDPLVRQFVGEDDTAHQAHYDYFYKLAKQHNKSQDYAGLDVESLNLEAAFEWVMRTGDAESALWLSNACGVFLANRGRFEQRLHWGERVAAALAGHPDKVLLLANAQSSLGLFYEEMPTGDHRANLSRAIAAYQEALKYRTSAATPLSYAQTQNNLGLAYFSLAEVEDRAANLSRAVDTFQEALKYWTPDATPLDYAMTQNNLGNAYSSLAEFEDGAANLSRAVAAYQEALKYRTSAATPLSYAMTQNNLGLAYFSLAKIEDLAANLSRAVAAYQEALLYRTPAAAPLDHAGTQNNLGNAYNALAQVEDPEANLSRALAAYQEALKYCTPDATPLDYAMTQNNLGKSYHDLAQVENRAANLSRAVAAYEEAIQYWTPAATLNHAMAQNNLGNVRRDQGDLPAAIACWREAEKYCRLMGMTRQADWMQQQIDRAESGDSSAGG